VKRVSASARSIIQEYLNMVDWRSFLTGGPQGGTEDWYTSPGFTQWRERQTTEVIPESEVGEMVKILNYGRRNNSNKVIHLRHQGYNGYGTN
jgi:hypothetical protein